MYEIQYSCKYHNNLVNHGFYRHTYSVFTFDVIDPRSFRSFLALSVTFPKKTDVLCRLETMTFIPWYKDQRKRQSIFLEMYKF